MRAGRTDANQGDMDDALEAMGWGVFPIQLIRCDRLIAKAGRLVLLEVKDGAKPPSERQLTPAEKKFHAAMKTYGIDVVTVERFEDLAQLDADARRAHEPGYRGRNYYPHEPPPERAESRLPVLRPRD